MPICSFRDPCLGRCSLNLAGKYEKLRGSAQGQRGFIKVKDIPNTTSLHAVLKAVWELCNKGSTPGVRKIVYALEAKGESMSDNTVRKCVLCLAEAGILKYEVGDYKKRSKVYVRNEELAANFLRQSESPGFDSEKFFAVKGKPASSKAMILRIPSPRNQVEEYHLNIVDSYIGYLREWLHLLHKSVDLLTLKPVPSLEEVMDVIFVEERADFSNHLRSYHGFSKKMSSVERNAKLFSTLVSRYFQTVRSRLEEQVKSKQIMPDLPTDWQVPNNRIFEANVARSIYLLIVMSSEKRGNWASRLIVQKHPVWEFDRRGKFKKFGSDWIYFLFGSSMLEYKVRPDYFVASPDKPDLIAVGKGKKVFDCLEFTINHLSKEEDIIDTARELESLRKRLQSLTNDLSTMIDVNFKPIRGRIMLRGSCSRCKGA